MKVGDVILTLWGSARVTALYVANHDGGDEDPHEKTDWTLHLHLVEPVVLPGTIHSVKIVGSISL